MRGLFHEVVRGVQVAAVLVVIASLAPLGTQPSTASAPIPTIEVAALAQRAARSIVEARVAEPSAPASAVDPLSDANIDGHQAPVAVEPKGPRVAIGFDLPRSEAPREQAAPRLELPPPPARIGPPRPPRPMLSWPLAGVPAPPPGDANVAHDPPALDPALGNEAQPEPESTAPSPEIVAAHWLHDVDRYRYMAQTGFTNAGLRRAFGERYEFVRLVAVSNLSLNTLPQPPELYTRALVRSTDYQKLPKPPQSNARIIVRGTASVPRFLPQPMPPYLRPHCTHSRAYFW